MTPLGLRRPARWVPGNAFELLENGEQFFPAVFDAIAASRHEVIVETFILFEDKVGLALHRALLEAARRGVRVDITVDGYGSPDLSERFLAELTEAGVRFHVFDPCPRFLGLRVNILRRMHRKIVVVDGELAFVGGINYSADHLLDYGPEAKQDYAVAVRGPIVGHIHAFARAQVERAARSGAAGLARRWFQRRRAAPADAPAPQRAGPAEAAFVTRDNQHHRDDIERYYRLALRAAQHRVVIANAYFFPGYRLLKEMRRAARRGVDVRLVLQGQPDMKIVTIAAGLLYDHLLRAGVRIFEYRERPLHGKVAVVDDDWATVGSSNLDPLSLALNLEANVIIRDPGFNATLRERLHALMRESCAEVPRERAQRDTLWGRLVTFVVFHVLRRFPRWASALPAHEPRLEALHLRGDARAASSPTARHAEAVPGADRVHEPSAAEGR